MPYSEQRQRTSKTPSSSPKVTFLQGLKLWAKQWSWSNIKKTWDEEYSRVYGNATRRIDYINQKMR